MSVVWDQYIHVRSSKFAPMPGEVEEIVNPGMYGKALSLYLQHHLVAKGHSVPFVVAEDWGWWIDVKDGPVKGGVCVHCGPGADGGHEFAICLGFSGVKRWSWKRFGTVDLTQQLESLFNDIVAILQADNEVEIVGIDVECPVGTEAE